MNNVFVSKFFLIFFLSFVQTQNIIKVGIMIPSNKDSTLHQNCGMYNSIGAIPVAIDRIVQERLLDNFNFT